MLKLRIFFILAIFAVAILGDLSGVPASWAAQVQLLLQKLAPFAFIHAIICYFDNRWPKIDLKVSQFRSQPLSALATIWLMPAHCLRLNLQPFESLVFANNFCSKTGSLAPTVMVLFYGPLFSHGFIFLSLGFLGFQMTIRLMLAVLCIGLILGLIYFFLELAGFLDPESYASSEERPRPLDSRSWFARWEAWWGQAVLAAFVLMFIFQLIPKETLQTYLGPHRMGLMLSSISSLIIEWGLVSSFSMGSVLFAQLGVTGNALAFFLTGLATQGKKMILLRGLSQSWAASLLYPSILLPQILFLGWLLNIYKVN